MIRAAVRTKPNLSLRGEKKKWKGAKLVGGGVETGREGGEGGWADAGVECFPWVLAGEEDGSMSPPPYEVAQQGVEFLFWKE